MTAFTALPEGYEQALRHTLMSRRLMLALNLAALIPMVCFGAGMFVLWAAYDAIDAPLTLPSPDISAETLEMVSIIAVLILVMSLHELCHGLGFKLAGVERVRYGVNLRRLVLYARPAGDAYIYRNAFILVGLLPLILITAGGAALMLVAPAGVRLALTMAVALNAGGAIGDIWTVIVILRERFPPDALAQDLGDTFVIYTRKEEVP